MKIPTHLASENPWGWSFKQKKHMGKKQDQDILQVRSEVVAGIFLTLACSRDTSSCWVALSNLISEFLLYYCILFCSIWLSNPGGLFFLKRKQGEWIWGKEEVVGWLGGVEGGKTMVRMHCNWEESIFNKKNNFKKWVPFAAVGYVSSNFYA